MNVTNSLFVWTVWIYHTFVSNIFPLRDYLIEFLTLVYSEQLSPLQWKRWSFNCRGNFHQWILLCSASEDVSICLFFIHWSGEEGKNVRQGVCLQRSPFLSLFFLFLAFVCYIAAESYELSIQCAGGYVVNN